MEVNSKCPFNFQCEDCLYNKKAYCALIAGEEEQVNLQEIADKIEKQDFEQMVKDTEALIKAREEREKPKEGTLEWFYSTHPPDYNAKEVLPLDGATVFGGGSKSGKRKKVVKKNNPFDYLRAEV